MYMKFNNYLKTCTATIIIALLITACGKELTPPAIVTLNDTRCTPNTAVILIQDGFMKTICGCQLPSEAPGTVFTIHDTLTCHLAPGIQIVLFNYAGAYLPHKINSTGPVEFVSSPISDPKSSFLYPVHSIANLQPATTYQFRDALSGLHGEFTTP